MSNWDPKQKEFTFPGSAFEFEGYVIGILDKVEALFSKKRVGGDCLCIYKKEEIVYRDPSYFDLDIPKYKMVDDLCFKFHLAPVHGVLQIQGECINSNCLELFNYIVECCNSESKDEQSAKKDSGHFSVGREERKAIAKEYIEGRKNSRDDKPTFTSLARKYCADRHTISDYIEEFRVEIETESRTGAK